MKKIIFLVIVQALILLQIYSQGYNALLNTNKSWSVLHIKSCSGFCTDTEIYKLFEDTIIENKSYFQLYYSFDTNNIFYPSTMFLREDTIEKKVYLYEPNYPEKLLYNFELSKGDTANIDVGCEQKRIVTNVDTIEVDNTIRKRIVFENTDDPTLTEYWIEGIGSTFGLTTPTINNCVSDGLLYLLCVIQSGFTIYSNPEFNSCYMSIVQVESLNNSLPEFAVIPNPVRDQSMLIISGLNGVKYQIEIFDLFGRKQFSQLSSGNSQHIINRSDYKSGIYIARIVSHNNILTRIKIQFM